MALAAESGYGESVRCDMESRYEESVRWDTESGYGEQATELGSVRQDT